MHLFGCPVNGFGGCYASCKCEEISMRNHTAALYRHVEQMRLSDNDKDDRIRELEEQVASLINKCGLIPPLVPEAHA